VIGDLEEAYAELWRTDPAGARRWYRRQAVAIGLHYVVARVRDGRRAESRGEADDVSRRRGTGMVSGFAYDVRHALRGLRRNPGFTSVAVVALALGIGTNAGTFAFIDAMAFRPLAVADPQELVALYGAREDASLLNFSYLDWQDYREGANSAFTDVAGFAEGAASLADGSDAVMVWTQQVTANYFTMLRPRAQVGRLLGEGDEASVVLSHGLWIRQFGSDPSVVGRTITLNGEPFTVVGVTAARFTGTRLFSYAPEVWLPIEALPRVRSDAEGWLTSRTGGFMQMVGRLRAGVSMAQAEAVTANVARSLAAAFPETHGGRTAHLFSNERPQNVYAFAPGQLRLAGLMVMGGVSLVLLIACANVANLQLARATSRGREIAVRTSLGASRSRIIGQRMAESVLLALAGGAVGMVVAVAILRVGAALQPPLDFAPAFEPALEWRVGVFTLIVATTAGVLAGVLPALREGRADPATTLRAASGGAARGSRVLDALVVAQVAISLVVLVAAGLFVQSLERQRQLDPGFPLANGVMLTVNPSLQGYTSERMRAFHERLLADLRSLPGVRAVTRSTQIPLDGSFQMARVGAEGLSASPQDDVTAFYYVVEPGFFDVLGVPIRDGREFTLADTSGAPLVAIVSHALVRTLWPDGSALGRRLRIGSSTAEVVGVVPDIQVENLLEPARPLVALSLRQVSAAETTLLLRTAGDPTALAPAVRRTVAALDPTLALIGLKTLEDGTRHTLSAVQGGAIGSGMFGVLALLLTVAGLYGVVAFTVARRAREIGIRVALGARTGSVVRMIVTRGLRLVAMGLILGVGAALALSSLTGRLLYGVSAMDPLTFAGAALLILGVCALASWVPARRAAGVDPLEVLRSD
jgi:predicted permease